MRSQLLLFPLALCAMANPVSAATIYLSGEEAQQLLFPGATFTDESRRLTDSEMAAVGAAARVEMNDARVMMWKVSTGGWFFVDQSPSGDTMYTYALALDAKGVVMGMEIMSCIEDFCRVRLPEWRAQFTGKKSGDLFGKDEIEIISGSTRSSVYITEGVRKTLATFDLLIRHPRRR